MYNFSYRGIANSVEGVEVLVRAVGTGLLQHIFGKGRERGTVIASYIQMSGNGWGRSPEGSRTGREHCRDLTGLALRSMAFTAGQ